MVLHEKLVGSGKSTLYDCCPVERLSHWASECNHMDEGLDEQIKQLKISFKKIKTNFSTDTVKVGQASMAIKLDGLNSRVIELESTLMDGVLVKGVSRLRQDYEYLKDILHHSTTKDDGLIEIVKMIGKLEVNI